MQDLQRMAKSVEQEDIKPALVLDEKPLTVAEYLKLPVSKKRKCKKETGAILAARILNKLKPTPSTEKPSLILDGKLIAPKEYAGLSTTGKKKCRKETRAFWPAEAVSLLTKQPEAQKALRVPVKRLATIGQNSHAEAAKPMARDPDTQGLVFNGKFISWPEYTKLREKSRVYALGETFIFLRGQIGATEIIKNILQEAEEYITYTKFHQKGSDKDVKSAVKAWRQAFVEFEKYQETIIGCPERQINGLVHSGKSLPWAVYMAYQKRYRNAVLLETWNFHLEYTPMAEVLWDIRQELERYISDMRPDYPNAEEVVAKTWKAWTWITGMFRKSAGKGAREMFKEYQKKRLGKPETIREISRVTKAKKCSSL
jgi:hypothetical protein